MRCNQSIRAIVVSGALLTMIATAGSAATLGTAAPEIATAVWLNSRPQTIAALRGKVVLLEFWTFACFNCRNVERHVKEWHRKYADAGLVVIGIHSPELPHERELVNVDRYLREKEIPYAIAIDNDFAIWNRYQNRAWPSFYLIDRKGILRYTRIGEGGYHESEERIRALLEER